MFTIEAEIDKSNGGTDPSGKFHRSSNDCSINAVALDIDQTDAESGYGSGLSSRKSSSISGNLTVPQVSVITTTPLDSQSAVSFTRSVSECEEISFDELSARRSTRERSLSNGSRAVSKLGRRSDPPSPNRQPEASDDLNRESFQRCPSEKCISPALCESFRRGPSVGFRQVNKRERRFSVCSDNVDAGGINVNLHNVIGKKGTGKGQFRNATSVSHISSGSIIVTDIINCRVTLFHGSGRVMNEIQTGPGSEPWATAVLPNGKLVVSLQKPRCLAIFSANGEFCTNIACDLLVKPSGVASDRTGRIVVSDVGTDSVYILDQDGEVLRRLGEEPEVPVAFEEPRYVNVTSKGHILVCDSAKHCVHVFDSEGSFLHSFGSYGQDSGQFRFPYGITSDFDENIYVADYYNNRVCMFTIGGEFLGHILTPCMKLKRPQGLDMRDGMADSILYVSHGEMKAQEVVAFKIIMGSKNRLEKAIEVHV